jgi:pSer/pThr/pTyr-binding forkhead associated (FHA) protein
MNPSNPQDNAGIRPRAVTMLESVEEMRTLVRRNQTMKEPIPFPSTPTPAAGPPAPNLSMPASAPAAPAAADDTERFRPVQRPTTPILVVLDDGDDDGEAIRIRKETFAIGRVQGDLVIPNDGNISGRHAEIVRRLEGGRWQWYLRDLQSTNGTFVRVSGGILRDGQEVLIGGLCFRFESSHIDDAAETAAGTGAPASTRKFVGGSIAQFTAQMNPTLIALTPDGGEKRYPLDRPELWVGRDRAACSIVLEDPLVSPKHARLFRDPKGKWMIQNNRSLNGIWMRITEVSLEKGGQFQCGEQRFLIRTS